MSGTDPGFRKSVVKLAEAVRKRHRPGPLHGNPQPRCDKCVWSLYPCVEAQLAEAAVLAADMLFAADILIGIAEPATAQAPLF